MGGYGSGRWHEHTAKETVEASLELDICRLARAGMLAPTAPGMTNLLTWKRTSTGEITSRLAFKVHPTGAGLTVCLIYAFRGEPVLERISLVTTQPPFGGKRWWFLCPLSVNGQSCGRRVGKLWLPPGARLFGCRHCYDLTYESCRESHKWDSLARVLAANMPGRSEESVSEWIRTYPKCLQQRKLTPREERFEAAAWYSQRPYRPPAHRSEPERQVKLAEAEAYCCRCRAPRTYRYARRVEMDSGRLAIRARCRICGAKVWRVVARPEPPGFAPS